MKSIGRLFLPKLDPAPLKTAHDFPLAPKAEDGPVTVTWELIIRPDEREEFLALTKELRQISLRNGAFLFRVDEFLERPGTFRTEMRVNSWAEHLQTAQPHDKSRDRACGARLGDALGRARAGGHSLPANRLSTPLGFGQFLKQFEARTR